MGRKRNRETGTKGDVPTCPSGYALERRTANGDYECDACSADIPSGNCFFGCCPCPCDYSLCGGCYVKAATEGLETTTHQDNPQNAGTGSTEVRIDPDVAELCDYYDIEDRIMLKLNEAMKARQESFAGDMEKLWEELKTARSPAGLLMSKVRQMQEGTFIGKVEPPKEVKRVIEKYRLDEDARTKLADFLSKRPQTAREELAEIERRLEASGKPSATVMTMIVKLQRGERLPEMPKQVSGSYSSYRDQDLDLFKRRSDRDRPDQDRGDRRRSRSPQGRR